MSASRNPAKLEKRNVSLAAEIKQLPANSQVPSRDELEDEVHLHIDELSRQADRLTELSSNFISLVKREKTTNYGILVAALCSILGNTFRGTVGDIFSDLSHGLLFVVVSLVTGNRAINNRHSLYAQAESQSERLAELLRRANDLYTFISGRRVLKQRLELRISEAVRAISLFEEAKRLYPKQR